jgi:hypothetical protein
MYDPSTGQFTRLDPIGLEGGTDNLYEYVGNNPINATDPSGLVRAGVNEALGGHHIIPHELWDEFGFSEGAREILDSGDARIKTPRAHGTHGTTAHGRKTGYTGHVRDELHKRLKKFRRRHNVPKGVLSNDLQEKFAKQMIRNFNPKLNPKMSNKFILGFNKRVGLGPKKLKKWFDKTGRKYKVRRYRKAVVTVRSGIAGLSLAAKSSKVVSRIAKFGKVPVIGLIVAPFTAGIAFSSARADGYSSVDAAAIAALEVANPLPVGYEEGKAVGEAVDSTFEGAHLIGSGHASSKQRASDVKLIRDLSKKNETIRFLKELSKGKENRLTRKLFKSASEEELVASRVAQSARDRQQVVAAMAAADLIGREGRVASETLENYQKELEREASSDQQLAEDERQFIDEGPEKIASNTEKITALNAEVDRIEDGLARGIDYHGGIVAKVASYRNRYMKTRHRRVDPGDDSRAIRLYLKRWLPEFMAEQRNMDLVRRFGGRGSRAAAHAPLERIIEAVTEHCNAVVARATSEAQQLIAERKGEIVRLQASTSGLQRGIANAQENLETISLRRNEIRTQLNLTKETIKALFEARRRADQRYNSGARRLSRLDAAARKKREEE